MIRPNSIDASVREALIGQLVSRMAGLRNDRQTFLAHWALLAEMFLPRRYTWLVTANNTQRRGAMLNASILDETGILAARTMASGMMSGMTSPTKAWFDLGLKDLAEVPYGAAKIWLDDCRKRMLKVLAQSNFYTSIHTLYHDNGVFGSAAMPIFEDAEQVIRCHNYSLGEFFFATSNRQMVDSLYREFVFTVEQTVQEFGLENCSEQVKGAYMAGGAQRTNEIVICHAIEPNSQIWADVNTPLAYAVPKKFEYREAYWEQSNQCYLLRLAGYDEKPFVGARWDVVSNEAYGRSPGMDAYAATKQVQVQQRRKAEAIDKMVRPPMNASVNMKNEPVSILPGAVNYVTDLANSGFAPTYKVEPRVQELGQDIDQTKERINSVFFVDLFLMIASLDTVRTATEIDARREEKLIQLGPVIERFENEVLDPIINRVFSIMLRRGLFADPPPELEGMEIDVQYVSMLAEAQKAARSAGTERFLGLLGNLAGVEPGVMDVADTDALLTDYADGLNVTPLGIRSAEQVEALRQQRAEQEQAVQQAEQAQQLAAGAKTLSETQVGGGQNALAAMMGGL
jgi:hypothetical protein